MRSLEYFIRIGMLPHPCRLWFSIVIRLLARLPLKGGASVPEPCLHAEGGPARINAVEPRAQTR